MLNKSESIKTDMEKRMTRIMFYGDSNTFGYDSRAIFGGRYPEVVRWTDVVDKNIPNLQVIARGMNGRCLPHTDYEVEAVIKLIQGSQPLDYFAIMLGTNDILLTNRPDPHEAARRMRALMMRLGSLPEMKENGGETEIILVVPPLMFPGSENHSPYREYEDASKILASQYLGIAEELGLRTIDASKWNVELDYDGVHISEKGSLEFAEYMTSSLRNIIKE